MARYRQLVDERGDPHVIRHKGVPAFVYAKESCKHCHGTGSIGVTAGCSACLGSGKKDGADCLTCRGSGQDPDGGKHHVWCDCLKHEYELKAG
jgi:RecJ-like exonuclease